MKQQKTDTNTDGAIIGTDRLGEQLAKSAIIAGNVWSELGQQIWLFSSHRLYSDVAFGRSLINCQNWKDIVTLQQEWLSETFSDYLKEWAKMATISTSESHPPAS